LWEEIDFIGSVVSPVVGGIILLRHEGMSLYDLIAFGVMAYKHFDGMYKRVYRVLIEELKLLPKV
jgi:hypothetical protein